MYTPNQQQVAAMLGLPEEPEDHGGEIAMWQCPKHANRVVLLHTGSQFKPELLLALGVAISYTRLGKVWHISAYRCAPIQSNRKLYERARIIVSGLLGMFGTLRDVLPKAAARFPELQTLEAFVQAYTGDRLAFDIGLNNFMLLNDKLLPVDIVSHVGGYTNEYY